MARFVAILISSVFLALPALAQQTPLDQVAEAQQVLRAAETAGALTYARSLYDDALWRLRFAQEHWNARAQQQRDQARMRAEEAIWAGRAALAKAQWLSTNATIRSLEQDIRRFGGTSQVNLIDESAEMEIDRGPNSRTRLAVAEAALQQARAAGGEQVPGHDLNIAERNLETARRIVRANQQSESADHLSYVAEMMARRAYYLARASEVSRFVPTLQTDRTRLADAAAARQAEQERLRREQELREAQALQERLAAEQARRQSAEVEELRRQVDENRRIAEQRAFEDRAAREEAERRLDEAIQRYQGALATASSAEAEALRRQIEDQQFALRALQERERMNEQAMSAEIERLRRELESVRQQGTSSAQLLTEREAELRRREEEFQRMRRDREQDVARRAELERQQQAAVAEAQRQRRELEAQAQQLERQVEQARQQAQQTQAELAAARREAEQTQAELARARQEIAARDVEARRLRMQQEIAAVAQTRTDQRGFIVTLPGIFFDTGRSELKAGARSTLTQIAEHLRTDESARIVVEGHTDSVGSEQANQALSERRAAAVFDLLVSTGIPAQRVTAVGRGESQPIATNRTAAGRQQNRRVELIITNQ